MQNFDKNHSELLKKYIYFSSMHDSIIHDTRYEFDKKTLHIKLINSTCNIKYHLLFEGVTIFWFTKGGELGREDAVLSFSIEDDYSPMLNWNIIKDLDVNEMLYLMFQMFCGSELHVLCKNVNIHSEAEQS